MKNKKYLFMISHPAHYHMFKFTMVNLQKNGHKVVAVIRPKDVLEQLCVNDNLDFYKLEERPKQWGLFGLFLSLISKTRKVFKIVKQEKVDLLIGSDGVLAYVGLLRRIPSFEFFEDDVQVIKLYAWMFFPLFTNLISPEVTNAGIWTNKRVAYSGYQKLSYLHPNQFVPALSVVQQYIDTKKPYFLLRFSKLDAHHDVSINGINNEIARKLVNLLEIHGNVYISSERKLDNEFEKYSLNIDPLDMHHIIAFSDLLIGDSQSMTVEAAVLGVPSIRFSDFVGRISVLEELEHKYHLTVGVKTNDVNILFLKINELLQTPNLKEIFRQRKDIMLADKIDVTKFYVWFIENYPESVTIMRENPEYQYKFK